MKGIILAGGLGTRLWPVTGLLNKHLLPVYDKPMIYYSLSTLMLAGIRDILIISTENQLAYFQRLLQDGHQWGVSFSYAQQKQPGGVAQAFTVGKNFIGNDTVCLILADNFFHGSDIGGKLMRAADIKAGAVLFAYYVKEPSQYGVVEIDAITRKIISFEEKPQQPKSNYAVTGLYFYDNQVIDFATSLYPSKRGELEITDVNKLYLKYSSIKMETLGRGVAWLDMGTHETLLAASNYIQVVEARQGLKIGCPEEIAWRMRYIYDDQLAELIQASPKNSYNSYLSTLLSGSLVNAVHA